MAVPKRLLEFRLPTLVPAIIAVIAGYSVVALMVFSVEIVGELRNLRASPQDNGQWSIAQLEVEFFLALDAARDVEAGTTDQVKNLRNRFDIFYSRVALLAESKVIGPVLAGQPAGARLVLLRDRLDAIVPLIDSPDAVLAANAGGLAAQLKPMRPEVRMLSLAALSAMTRHAEEQRTAFAHLLLKTATITLVLIVLLAAVLAVLRRQNGISRRRASEVRLAAMRYETTLNASPTAIVVSSASGEIVEFNPAAERTFRCVRTDAIGRNICDMMLPAEDRGPDRDTERDMARYTDRDTERDRGRNRNHGRAEDDMTAGFARHAGKEGVVLRACRADGEVFPAELTLARSPGPDGPIHVAYVNDITERLRAENALTDASDRAHAAAKAKSQFLAIMSHEMRTPLNGVLGLLDVLGATTLDDRQRAYVDTALASGEILQHHIDEFLDLTRIEAGRIELVPEPFDFTALLEDAARMSRPAAHARGNVIAVRSGIPEMLLGDRRRVRQVLLNLVGNAVKFTEDGFITIVATAGDGAEGGIVLAVTDTGIGIAAADHGRIFDDFVTLDPSYRRTASGYGLGLAICRRIVGAMGGEIAVDSSLGAGSRFTVRLPLPFAQSAATVPEPVRMTPAMVAAVAAEAAAAELKTAAPKAKIATPAELSAPAPVAAAAAADLSAPNPAAATAANLSASQPATATAANLSAPEQAATAGVELSAPDPAAPAPADLSAPEPATAAGAECVAPKAEPAAAEVEPAATQAASASSTGAVAKTLLAATGPNARPTAAADPHDASTAQPSGRSGDLALPNPVRDTSGPAVADGISTRPSGTGSDASVILAVRRLDVLLVDDNCVNRFAAREMLLRETCNVVEADDGLIGHYLSERSRFDLVLMDISMPRLDGMEATRRIRAGAGLSAAAPVVGLTAHALPDEQLRLREAGMQDCIIKPLRVRQLRAVLASIRASAADDAPVLGRGSTRRDHRPGTVVDDAVIGELRELLSAAVFERQLGAFRAEIAALGGELRSAWTASGIAAAGRLAHLSCGSASMFGVTEVRDILSTLEEVCLADEEESAELLLVELERASRRALAALDRRLPQVDRAAFVPV